jgi:hypothetical protein
MVKDSPPENFRKKVPAGARHLCATQDATRPDAILNADARDDCAPTHILNARIDGRRGCAGDPLQGPAAEIPDSPRDATRFSVGPDRRMEGAAPTDGPTSAVGAAARRPEPRGAAGPGELAHAQNIALTFRHRDHAARVEKVEGVARLDALVIGGQRHEVPRVA